MSRKPRVYNAERTPALFHASDAFVRGLMGPVGSGKSVACCMEILSRAIRQRPNFPTLPGPLSREQMHRTREIAPGFFQHCIFSLFCSYCLSHLLTITLTHLHTCAYAFTAYAAFAAYAAFTDFTDFAALTLILH